MERGEQGREREEKMKKIFFALKGFSFKGFMSLLTMLIYWHLLQHPTYSIENFSQLLKPNWILGKTHKMHREVNFSLSSVALISGRVKQNLKE